MKVVIQVDEQGNYSVGQEDDSDEGMETMQEDQAEFTPAKNIDDALAQAKQLLMQSAGKEQMAMRDEVAGQVFGGGGKMKMQGMY